MIHFLAGVYNSLFSTTEYNVLIVGRECTGKSTLLEQLKFLYTPATQQRELEELSSSCQHGSTSMDGPQSSSSASASLSKGSTRSPEESLPNSPAPLLRRPSLPPGAPRPATAAQMSVKRIRPTVGLNYAVVQHKFSPPVAVISRVKSSAFPSRAVPSLPPLSHAVLTEQRVRQQAALANAPSQATTRVVLRDLGGQVALRDLWDKYYPLSQALVYVVDSTLPFRVPRSATTEPPPQPRDHYTKKELEELYAPDSQLLGQLLQHPLLRGVPVLLLSNKIDAVPHLPLLVVQEALRLDELAAAPIFYMTPSDEGEMKDVSDSEASKSSGVENCEATKVREGGTRVHRGTWIGSSRPTADAPLSRHCASAEEAQRQVGESGFGEVAMRIMEVSALDGVGVAGAMDWLVAQLLHGSRTVDSDVH